MGKNEGGGYSNHQVNEEHPNVGRACNVVTKPKRVMTAFAKVPKESCPLIAMHLRFIKISSKAGFTLSQETCFDSVNASFHVATKPIQFYY